MASLVVLLVVAAALFGGFGVLTALVVGVAWWVARREEQAQLETLRELDFTVVETTAEGELSGHPVAARRLIDGSWSITMEGLPADIALRTSTTGTKANRTGDRVVDERWAIGSVEGGVGRLGRQARLVLARVRPVVDSFVLSGGELTTTVPSGANLPGLLANLERLALELSGAPLEGLVETVRTDPNPRVRGHMLWQLAQVNREVAIETIERRDPDASWGSEELLLMGELLGRRTFLERALEHPETGLKLAGRIVSAWLILEEDIGPALAIMGRRFGPNGLSLAADRLGSAHAHHAPALIPWVSRVVQLRRETTSRQRAAVSLIRTLQGARVAAALPELVYAAQEMRGPAQVRAIQAVGSLGDTSHVTALREVQGRLAITDFAAQGAIDTAVAAIQGRAGGQAGALSLAAPTGGGLALAESAGDLAVAEEVLEEEVIAPLPPDEGSEEVFEEEEAFAEASGPPPRARAAQPEGG